MSTASVLVKSVIIMFVLSIVAVSSAVAYALIHHYVLLPKSFSIPVYFDYGGVASVESKSEWVNVESGKSVEFESEFAASERRGVCASMTFGHDYRSRGTREALSSLTSHSLELGEPYSVFLDLSVPWTQRNVDMGPVMIDSRFSFSGKRVDASMFSQRSADVHDVARVSTSRVPLLIDRRNLVNGWLSDILSAPASALFETRHSRSMRVQLASPVTRDLDGDATLTLCLGRPLETYSTILVFRHEVSWIRGFVADNPIFSGLVFCSFTVSLSFVALMTLWIVSTVSRWNDESRHGHNGDYEHMTADDSYADGKVTEDVVDDILEEKSDEETEKVSSGAEKSVHEPVKREAESRSRGKAEQKHTGAHEKTAVKQESYISSSKFS